jgi:Nucleotidyl transferase AbiEii toxin, Type IV TA system
MAIPRTYATAGAFRKALEERLKSMSQTEQIDINRLRRQVSFDRLLARLFREDSAPWVLKGGYALELRFKSARSSIDIDLTLQRVVGTEEGSFRPEEFPLRSLSERHSIRSQYC